MRPAILMGSILLLNGCGSPAPTPRISDPPSVIRRAPSGSASKILAGAKDQLESPSHYTGQYFSIPYPGGDLPPEKGACVDVVIRALRHAGYDLQVLIHQDAKAHPTAYPRIGRPDASIDHRRVPNQRVFFTRHGRVLSNRTDGVFAKQWLPGDIVTWKLDSGLDHTGIVSDMVNGRGLPSVIHNLSVTAEEDVLTRWQITGHYRYPAR